MLTSFLFKAARRSGLFLLPLLPLCGPLAAGPCVSAAPTCPTPASPAPRLVSHVPSAGFPWSRQRQQDKEGYYQQTLGLCEDYPWRDRNQAKLDADFKIAREIGAKVLRVGIPWLDIESAPGQYRWEFWDALVDTAVRNQVLLIPYVCYTPPWAASAQEDFWKQPPADPARFGAFMRVIADRYRGRVRSWELWNEPDNHDFWLGSASQYAQMVRAGAAGVRQGDPGATVVLGGMSDGESDFLSDLLTTYGVGACVDVLNVHGYFETWNPQALEDYTGYIGSVAGSAGRLHPTPDLWLAEFGYSSPQAAGDDGASKNTPASPAYQHTADYQAAALFKSHVLAAATGCLSLTAWYRIHDLTSRTHVIGDDQNRFLGIVDLDGKPKPAFAALRFYGRLFGVPTRCLDGAVRIGGPAGAQTVTHVFAQKSGTVIITGWLRGPQPGETTAALPGGPDRRPEEVSVTLPAGEWGPLRVYSVDGGAMNSVAVLSGNTLRHVVLTGARPFIATVSRRGPAPAASVPRPAPTPLRRTAPPKTIRSK